MPNHKPIAQSLAGIQVMKYSQEKHSHFYSMKVAKYPF